jgi:starvation-inducible outer membrane lipoprotein
LIFKEENYIKIKKYNQYMINKKIYFLAITIAIFLSGCTSVSVSSVPFNVGERSVIWVEAGTDVNNARATCRFSGVLVDDI